LKDADAERIVDIKTALQRFVFLKSLADRAYVYQRAASVQRKAVRAPADLCGTARM
jgi:hypothetical protein